MLWKIKLWQYFLWFRFTNKTLFDWWVKLESAEDRKMTAVSQSLWSDVPTARSVGQVATHAIQVMTISVLMSKNEYVNSLNKNLPTTVKSIFTMASSRHPIFYNSFL